MQKKAGPGTYACLEHADQRVTMFIEFRAANCGRCGKPLEKVADLTVADIREQRDENKRAAREEAKLARAGL